MPCADSLANPEFRTSIAWVPKILGNQNTLRRFVKYSTPIAFKRRPEPVVKVIFFFGNGFFAFLIFTTLPEHQTKGSEIDSFRTISKVLVNFQRF
jgi:hypothetical protein